MRPRQVVFFIAGCLILLGVLCAALPRYVTCLHWPNLVDVLELQPKDTLSAAVAVDTLDYEAPEVAEEAPVAAPKQAPAAAPKAEDPLALFREGLAQASIRQVRVVHYGDSQIEEDRISNNIRQHLQSIYGGSGTGWVSVPQNVPSKTTKMTVTMGDKPVTRSYSPKRYTVFGKSSMNRPDTNCYGAFGQMIVMDSLLVPESNRLHIHIQPLKDIRPVNYFSQVRVWTQGDIAVDGQTTHLLTYPDSTTQCDIELTGQGDVYGLSLESTTGVMVDNVPMRGAIGNVFTKMDQQQLTNYYRETNTRLIILQFGGNLMPGAQSPNRIYNYIRTMRQQIAFLKQCAPEASVVFIGASDMLTTIDGERTSYPYLGLLDEQLVRMAQSEGIGYWSLYQAMGGKGGMEQWQMNGLAASDGVHFTHKGANRAGELFWQWLESQLTTPLPTTPLPTTPLPTTPLP